MRNITQTLSDAIEKPKAVHVRATFRKTLPVFNVVSISSNIPLSPTHRIDACEYGDGILRVTNYLDVLYEQNIQDVSSWAEWVSSDVTLYPGSNPSVDSGFVWYQDVDGGVCKRNYLTGETAVLGAFSSLVEISSSVNNAWVMYKPSPTGSRIEIVMLGASRSSYGVYGDITFPSKFDVVSIGDKNYIYTMDRDAGRVVEIVHTGDCYGVSSPIIPIDAIDNDYGLVLGGVNVINDRVVVTGRLTRTSDGVPVIMDVYSIGPKNFSLGLEMYIQSEEVINGKMLLVGDALIVSGVGHYAIADATILFGVDNPYVKVETNEFSSVSISETENRSTSMKIDASPSLANIISPGSQVDVEMTYDDGVNTDWVKLSTCSVSDTSDAKDTFGSDFAINAVGKTSKRLNSWSPDQGVYIPSQATMFTNPKTLDQMVRAKGTWEDAPDTSTSNGIIYPIQLKEFNKLGVLYSAERSSRGGVMRGRFYFPDAEHFSTYHGVAINYYLETAQEASERLGVKVCFVDKSSYGQNGIVAIYSPKEHLLDDVKVPGVGLYVWTNDVMVLLTSVPFEIPANTLHWLQIEFIEGEVRVKYKLDTEPEWTDVLFHLYEDERLPWKRETLGRGAIVMKNVTPSLGGYAISATDTIIGVDDNTDYPPTGTIMLDGEVVEYTGKSLYNIYKDPSNPGYQVKTSSAYSLDQNFLYGTRCVLWTNNTADEAHGKEDGYYTNCAAVVRGKGVGNTYKVVNFDSILPSQWVPNTYYHGWTEHIGDLSFGHWQDCDANTVAKGFYLSPSPDNVISSDGDIGEVIPSSRIVIKPSLYGLIRGAGAVAHDDSSVSVYVNAHVLCDAAAYFTQDEDISLDEAISSIVKRSGGEASSSSSLSQSVNGVAQVPGSHKNFISTFTLPILNDGESAGVCFRGIGDFSLLDSKPFNNMSAFTSILWERVGDYWYLVMRDDDIVVEKVKYYPVSGVRNSLLPVPVGDCKVSVHDNVFSVWLNGRYFHTFYFDARQDGDKIAFFSNAQIYARVSELDDLLPTVVIGVRGNGMSVLSELIAERHIMFREESDGSLFFYRSRQQGITVPDIISARSRIASDNFITRIRAEGVELAEVIDVPSMKDHGNSFATVNVRYANTLLEAEKDAILIMKETKQKANTTMYSMVVHPSIQPGDIVVIDGDELIVTNQSIAIGFVGDTFACDMQIQTIGDL